MKFKEFLLEYRKNAEVNKKESTVEALERIYEEYPNDKLYVSFTEVDKLGINPLSKYETPIGVYAYPLEYVISRGIKRLPFANERKYINVFKANGNILELDKVVLNKELLNKIYSVSKSLLGINDKNLLNSLLKRSETESYSTTDGGKFWFIVMRICQRYAQLNGKKKHIVMNKFFREMGIDGCVDRNGDGVIHPMEPIQAVFFRTDVIELIERVKNHINKRNPITENNIKILLKMANSAKTLDDVNTIEAEIKEQDLSDSIKKKLFTKVLMTFFSNPNVSDEEKYKTLIDKRGTIVRTLKKENNFRFDLSKEYQEKLISSNTSGYFPEIELIREIYPDIQYKLLSKNLQTILFIHNLDKNVVYQLLKNGESEISEILRFVDDDTAKYLLDRMYEDGLLNKINKNIQMKESLLNYLIQKYPSISKKLSKFVIPLMNR